MTATPTPASVAIVLTQVVQATLDATTTGTATPTPLHQVVAPTAIVVTNTPTPRNAATATEQALRSTLVAFLTGTPPAGGLVAAFVTATATPLPPPATWTPVAVVLAGLPTPTSSAVAPFPAGLVGKILFKADFDGPTGPQREVMLAMNPDGSGLAQLTGTEFYKRAEARDAYSADRRFYVFADREEGGTRLTQLFYTDSEYGSRTQLTKHGAGTAWAPAWSPTGEVAAYVSNESRGDEIWLVRKGEWPPTRLTNNTWEWDLHPSWSPDGQSIIFSSNRHTGIRQIWIMDADGGNQRVLVPLPFEAWDPVWVKFAD